MRIYNGAHVKLSDGLRLGVQARGTKSNTPGLEISITLPLELCDELGLILHGSRRQMEPSAQAIRLVQDMVDQARAAIKLQRSWTDHEPRREMIPMDVT